MCYFSLVNKADLVRELASRNKTTKGEAADRLDNAISQLLRKLRQGSEACLPGLGTISPDRDWTFRPSGKK